MAKGKYQEWLEPEKLILIAGWGRAGLTDEQIAKNIGISRSTLNGWKKKYSDISDTLKQGKEVIDRQVENALLKRAIGYEYEEVSEKFEENGIDFMPLKGSVIRSLYPKQEMRSMGDADVLIHAEQYNKIVPILEKNDFTFVKENLNELCWQKLPFYIELHRYLVSPQYKWG